MVIDFDNTEYSPEFFYDTVQNKPTYLHTTFSQGYKEGNCYHAIYLFHEKITSKELYNSIYCSIIEGLKKDIEELIIKDNCGHSPLQLMNSNHFDNENFEEYYDKNEIKIYSINDFVITFPIPKVSSSFKNNNPQSNTLLFLNEQFAKDYYTLSSSDMIAKYRESYPYQTATPIKFTDGYSILDEDYIEIYRKWYKGKGYKKNGDEYTYTAVQKIQKGYRAKTLYQAAILFRKIIPNITLEHLCFCLLCERYYYYTNVDKELNNHKIFQIACSAMSSVINIKSKIRKRFIVDKEYCKAHGVSANQYKQQVKKELKDKEIGRLYDCSLSVMENLEILNQNGIKIGKTRLYQWVKEFILPDEYKDNNQKNKGPQYYYQLDVAFNFDKKTKNEEYIIQSFKNHYKRAS